MTCEPADAGLEGPDLWSSKRVDVFIQVPRGAELVSIFGPADRNVKMVREALGVRISMREGKIKVSGEPRELGVARRVMEQLTKAAASRDERYGERREVMALIARTSAEASDDGEQTTQMAREGWEVGDPSAPAWEAQLNVYVGGKPVKAQTANQQAYLDAIRDHDVVFGIGPAGTGKTYLAVAAAVHLLKMGRCRKVILARPAVEAGEKLGFLPGDLQQKVNPYLRPLLDALHEMMDFNTIRRFMETDVVEIVPLAYMRGRTLNRAVIILDEAQNTTRGQMRMFLTRMGHGSKIIVTGDVTQVDLEDPTESGLIDAVRTLKRVPGLAFSGLDQSDIVRHPMVQKIVDAYEKTDKPRTGSSAGSGARRGGGGSMQDGSASGGSRT